MTNEEIIQQLTDSNILLAQSNDALEMSVYALIAGLVAFAFILGTKAG
ncbi:hypothetical protein [Halomonas sp. HL-93]|nr:hypothetical protein [Halomonas sp. HL-93]SBR45133.1 hypothetical protein GA0071314_0088 [Halomonas sp. HL-93]